MPRQEQSNKWQERDVFQPCPYIPCVPQQQSRAQRASQQKSDPHHNEKNTYNYVTERYISSETCRTINPICTHVHSHFLIYIDARWRYLIIYFLKDRIEVRLIMQQPMSKLHNANRTPQYYRTDNALEFKSKTALKTYAEYGITYKNNTPHQAQKRLSGKDKPNTRERSTSQSASIKTTPNSIGRML